MVNLVLLRTAIFLKLVGWIATSINALLMLGMAGLAFLQLTNFQKKYCLGSVNDECQFGYVLTYSALGYLLAGLAGLFVVVQIFSYKRICQSTQLTVLATVITATKKHIGIELVMAVNRILVTAFFGSALMMAASDSAIIQTLTSGIDSGVINTLVFN